MAKTSRTGMHHGMDKTPVPAEWQKHIDDWLLALRAAGRSEQTIETRQSWIRHCARGLERHPFDVTFDDLLRFLGAADWSRETRRSVYATLRGFYRWAVATGRTNENPAEKLPAVKPSPPLPRPVPDEVLREAVQNADERTALILTLAVNAGLRRVEIAQIHADDLFKDLYGYSLLVRGKGGKKRIVPIDKTLAIRIKNRAAGSYLFPSERGEHITPRHCGRLASAVLPGKWTLHSLRHAFASRAYAATSDLLAIQTLLGHSTPSVTQRYVRLPDARLRAVAESASA